MEDANRLSLLEIGLIIILLSRFYYRELRSTRKDFKETSVTETDRPFPDSVNVQIVRTKESSYSVLNRLFGDRRVTFTYSIYYRNEGFTDEIIGYQFYESRAYKGTIIHREILNLKLTEGVKITIILQWFLHIETDQIRIKNSLSLMISV